MTQQTNTVLRRWLHTCGACQLGANCSMRLVLLDCAGPIVATDWPCWQCPLGDEIGESLSPDLVRLETERHLRARVDRAPYLIWTPPYQHNSGGIRALHRLCHLLNERGYPAYATTPGSPEWNERYWALFVETKPERVIRVYPEIVFTAADRNRVRWVLNVPGFIGGPSQYDPDELVFSWSTDYVHVPTDRLLTVDTVEHDLFNQDGIGERDADRFWVGKGANKGIALSPITEGMEQITYSWPAERAELAALLKRTKTLYTYDDRSQLNWEALLCGCKVVLLPQDRELTLAEVALSGDCAGQLANFIKITQEWAT